MHRPAKSISAPSKATAEVLARPCYSEWLVAGLLALMTIALYWPTTRYDFVNYDDPDYVTANVHVQNGLTLAGIKWAFLNPVAENWHPVTVLSHMLDCQLFGLKPWGHHLINVLLHALNVALVFALLQQMTGTLWQSALVAALFGWHPLHVESVAWVAERKDVLSGFFGLLTLICYARYAQKRAGAGSRESGTGSNGLALDLRPWALDYCLALFCFALCLMSKPTLVTMPFVMLLLDYWPLKRFTIYDLPVLRSNTAEGGRFTIFRLVREKIPFFALAAAASVVTLVVQRIGGSLVAGENLPLGARAGNALISYCRYLGKIFYPTDLAVFYPHRGYWPMEQVLLAGGLLLGLTFLFFVQRRRYPFLLMGWLWFVGTLVPMIGLVQTGGQAMADRHTYIPSLGVLILAVWGVFELTRRWRYHAIALWLAGSVAMVLCLAVTRQQLGYWQDNETLFRHALAVTENNFLAHNNLGDALLHKGQIKEALSHFQEAVRINPLAPESHNNLGLAYLNLGQTDKAISQFQEALRRQPDFVNAHINLGIAFLKNGDNSGAASQFRETVRLKPDFVEAHLNLGIALLNQGQTDEAISQFQEALRLRPGFTQAQTCLARALEMKNAPAGR